MKQLRTVSTLDRCYGGAGSRLHDVQRLGGTRDILTLRHGDEDSLLVQHLAGLSRTPSIENISGKSSSFQIDPL
jgi:hypothetical protein